MDPYLNLNNSGASNLTLGANELAGTTVVNNGYTGQYGRNAGAQVDYVTKSGTDNFHGNLSYWYNGSFLNANEWFANQSGTPLPNVLQHQYAASLGGPIFKGKTHFFVDVEGLRAKIPTSQQVIIPSPQFQSFVLGNLAATGNSAAIPFYQNIFNLYNGAPGASRATPVTSDLSPSLSCGAFTGGGAFGPGGVPCGVAFRSNATNASKEWMLTGRIDQTIGPNDTLFGRFRTDHGVQPTFTDPINPIFNVTSTQPQYEGQLNYTHAFSAAMTNQAIISGSWYSAIFAPSNLSATLQTFPTTLNFPTFTSLGAFTRLVPQGRNVTQYMGVDDFSIQAGNHNLKFGVNFRRNDVTDFTFGIGSSGRARLTGANALTTFAAGNVSSFAQSFPTRLSQPLALYSLGLYGQDEMRVAKNLKVTLALRIDRNSNATCRTNCFSRFVNNFSQIPHGLDVPYNQSIATGLSDVFPNLEAIAWQPRVGFAWSLFGGNNPTVLRGGAGLFADLYPAVLADNFATNPPNVVSFTFTRLPLAPAIAGNAFSTAAGANAAFQQQFASGGTLASIQGAVPTFVPPDFNSVNNNVTNPKFLEWNLELQQAMGAHGSISLNYVGNHGYDIFVSNPMTNAFCDIPTCGGAFGPLPTSAPDPRFGTVTDLRNRAVSNYNGLTISVNRQFGSWFQVKAGYTWSHALDEVSNGGILPYSLDDSILTQIDPTNIHNLNYGNADYDIRHAVSASYVVDVPFKFSNGLVRSVLGGWQLGGTFFARTGLPFTVINSSLAGVGGLISNSAGALLPAEITGSPSLNCDAPKPVAAPAACLNAADFNAAQLTFGNQPRNQFRGPRFFDADVNFNKSFAVTERTRIGVGANIFNVFNHPNFANPDFDIASGTFGNILSTVALPTSPYGSFVGAAASARIIQLNARVTF
jgi:hypothetical protein